MDELLHALKGHAAAMDRQYAQPSIGTVRSVKPGGHEVKVEYEDGHLSGWLSVATQSAGAGWGVLSMPKPGQQVLLVPRHGTAGAEVVAGFLHSEANPTTKAVAYKASGDGDFLEPGEAALVHESGASIRLRAGGVIESRGTWLHDGDFKASGQVRDLDGERGTLEELRARYDAHRHPGVRAGSEVSAGTDRPTP